MKKKTTWISIIVAISLGIFGLTITYNQKTETVNTKTDSIKIDTVKIDSLKIDSSKFEATKILDSLNKIK